MSQPLMRSRDLVSVSRLIFESLDLLVLKATGLETWNFPKKWFSKIYKIQSFCLFGLQVRNNQNMSENARN